MPEPPTPLIVLGFGNMGRSIVRGALRAGAIQAADTLIVDPSDPSLAEARGLGLRAEPHPRAAAELVRSRPSRLLLAIKPQMLPDLARELAPVTRDHRCDVISILAGMPIARLRAALGEPNAYIRVMPNLPASVGRGISALCPAPGASEPAIQAATRLFESVGVVRRLDEGLMDAFTAVAGSGPAYVFLLGEAMALGAERVGFDPATARELVRATLAGSSALLERDPRAFAELRAGVTSKGGTTAAALSVLDGAGFVELVARAIAAARDRGRELGSG